MEKLTERIHICVVGLGHWGPNIVRSFEGHQAALVTCGVDASEERRKFIQTKLPNLNLYESLDQALNTETIDAVVIASPTQYHFQLGMRALDAGKHIFVEKPLTNNPDSSQELIEKAEQSGKTLMCGHIFLFNEGIREMKRIVKREELGKVLYMRSIRTNLGPIRSDINALWDLASHDISIFNYIYDSIPVEVSCSAHHLLGRQVEDIAQASLVYPENRIATFFVSWLDPQKKREITVVGDRKMLTFDDMNPRRPLKIFDKGVTVSKPSEYADSFHSFRMSIHEGNIFEPQVSTGEPLKNECHHFVDCILNQEQPVTDGSNGLEVVKVLEALSRSLHENGKPVSLW